MIVPMVAPAVDYETRQAYGELLRCVDQHRAKERTRRYLQLLWEYLKTTVATDEGQRLGQRQLSKLLGIPRDRFRELDSILRRWVERCRATLGGTAERESSHSLNRQDEDTAVRGSGEASAAGEEPSS